MIEEAIEAIKNSSLESSIYVGADSVRFKKNGRWFAKYCTVIVIHKDSSSGCKIFYERKVLEDYGNLKQRLMTEVGFAVEAALAIVDVLDGRQLSVHLDLNSNPNHKSHVAVKEATGWVLGTLGFEPVLKPKSIVASNCADHFVKEKLED